MSSAAPGPPDPFALGSGFRDFEAFREVMAGWDLDFRQLEAGAFEAHVAHVLTPTVLLSRCGFNRKMDQKGAPPEGYRTFGIPADDSVRVRWRGREYDGRTLMLFPASGELDSVSAAGFDVFTISVSEAVLEDASRRLGLPGIDDLFPDSLALRYGAEQRGRLRGVASSLARTAVTRPDLVTTGAFRERLEIELVESLLDAVGHGRVVSARPMACSRKKVLNGALEIIQSRADEPVTILELQRQTGASERTLRYAFEEEFGVSPKQYLQSYRLNRVQQALARANPSTSTVADVANAWGFWHMGQLASDYRKMFGELPSKTLRRARIAEARPPEATERSGSPGRACE